MGRRRFKAFIPPTPPPGFVMPANGSFTRKWEKPPVIAPTTAGDVDKAKKRRSITSDYAIGSDDHFLGVDSSGGIVTLTLPATAGISEGKIYIIKDEGGAAATNAIKIQTADSARIDSLNSISLVSNYGAVSIYYNSTDWHIY
tara:strand:- start:149 stop:577 length:429 start_codon:yes stop_codon:yes gene_type:complete